MNLDERRLYRMKSHEFHVKALIYEAYIVEKVSIFISYYFEHHTRIKINRVPKHDGGGEIPSVRVFQYFFILVNNRRRMQF
jgi:hypothetical protein